MRMPIPPRGRRSDYSGSSKKNQKKSRGSRLRLSAGAGDDKEEKRSNTFNDCEYGEAPSFHVRFGVAEEEQEVVSDPKECCDRNTNQYECRDS